MIPGMLVPVLSLLRAPSLWSRVCLTLPEFQGGLRAAFPKVLLTMTQEHEGKETSGVSDLLSVDR